MRCRSCDRLAPLGLSGYCTDCEEQGDYLRNRRGGRKLTRTEFEEGLADRGIDTLEDYRCEK